MYRNLTVLDDIIQFVVFALAALKMSECGNKIDVGRTGGHWRLVVFWIRMVAGEMGDVHKYECDLGSKINRTWWWVGYGDEGEGSVKDGVQVCGLYPWMGCGGVHVRKLDDN